MAVGGLDLRGQLLDAQYRVEACIGRGGMGEVWRVRHLQTGEVLALKTIRGSLQHDRKVLRRLILEARAATAVQSRNVIRVLNVNPDYVHEGSELPYILMEHLEGQNLSEFLEHVSTLQPSKLLWVMHQVSQALSSAHARGIVHRDLKPSNLFLAEDEPGALVVKVCDFGIAKLQGAAIVELAETGTLSTETGELLGTPRYMAPEQLRRAGREGPATDQWAFALIAFRALTGRNYFESVRNAAELILAIVHEPLPSPSSLSALASAAFDEWFARSCDRDPNARFSSIDEQQLQLQLALGVIERQPIDVSLLVTRARATSGAPQLPQSNVAPNGPAVSKRASARPFTGSFYAFLVAATVVSILGARWLNAKLSHWISAPPSATSASVSGSAPAIESAGEPRATLALPAGTQLARSIDVNSPKASSTSDSTTTQRTAPVSANTNKSKSTLLHKTRRQQLPQGAACTRSSQCAGGVCAAEVCQ